MRIVRMKTFSKWEDFKTVTKAVGAGAIAGGTIVLPVALVAGGLGKLGGKKFNTVFGLTIAGGAIVGGLLGLLISNSELVYKHEVEKLAEFRNRHYEDLKRLVQNSLPGDWKKLQTFANKFELFNSGFDKVFDRSLGYNIYVPKTEDELITRAAAILLRNKAESVPTSMPIPFLSIECGVDINETSYLLYYDRSKKAYIDLEKNKTVSPKEFLLDCIDNKFDCTLNEDEEWFIEYKAEAKKFISKNL